MKFTTAVRFDGYIQENQPKVQVVLASGTLFRKRYWVFVDDNRVNSHPIKEQDAKQFATALRDAWAGGAMTVIRSI